jgi:hypothetical protein
LRFLSVNGTAQSYGTSGSGILESEGTGYLYSIGKYAPSRSVPRPTPGLLLPGGGTMPRKT